MLHRAPVLGRRREHHDDLCGSHCLSVVGLTAWGAPARGWQVPSESVTVSGRRGVGKVPWKGAVAPRDYATAAGGGRLNLASSPFPPPAGRAEGSDTRRWSPGHRPGRGSPRRPGCSSPAESAGLRASGTAEWRRAYVGSWVADCRRPFPGDCVLQSSSRSAAFLPRSRAV